MAWIRSQNKKILGDFDYITVLGNYLKAFQRGDEGLLTIGTYQDNKTALAELDVIERWIADGVKGVYQVSS